MPQKLDKNRRKRSWSSDQGPWRRNCLS